MLEGPVASAIDEGWWETTAEYFKKVYEFNYDFVQIFNRLLSAINDGSMSSKQKIEREIFEKLIAPFDELLFAGNGISQAISSKCTKKSAKAAEISHDIQFLLNMYSSIHFKILSKMLNTENINDLKALSNSLISEDWLPRLIQDYVEAYLACIDSRNWRPFMRNDMRFPNNLEFHKIKVAGVLSYVEAY
jgi:hypothetical protein